MSSKPSVVDEVGDDVVGEVQEDVGHGFHLRGSQWCPLQGNLSDLFRIFKLDAKEFKT